MRKLKWVVVFLMVTIFAFNESQAADGIKFTKSSWDKVLKEAKKKGKNIFVDCYTTWCGPCKLMDKKTFTDQAVADFFNENYINVHMDMESEEGLLLNQYFYVSVYPTLLFLDSDGNTLEHATGYRPAEDFLELGKQALTMPIKKKYAKVNLANERKKETDLQKNKYLNMVNNAGYTIEDKDWETSMADAKKSGKDILVIYGDTYWPLQEEMTVDATIKYLSENFELKVVSLMGSYLRDENGETIKDENDNLLVNDWLEKYSPSSFPSIVFINSNGDKLIDGGQTQALEIGKLVQKGYFKPTVGFMESTKNAGLSVFDVNTKDEAFKKSSDESKPLIIMWYRTKGNDLYPVYGDEAVKKELSEKFVLLAMKSYDDEEITKKYQYRGAGSLSIVKPGGELLSNFDSDPTITQEQMLKMLDDVLKNVAPSTTIKEGGSMIGITPAKQNN